MIFISENIIERAMSSLHFFEAHLLFAKKTLSIAEATLSSMFEQII